MKQYIRPKAQTLIRVTVGTEQIIFCETDLKSCIREIGSIFSDFLIPGDDKIKIEAREYVDKKNGKIMSIYVYGITQAQIFEKLRKI